MADTSPTGLLAAALDADPARPFITYYDDATGERTELSVATLDNWVAKTANLLVDGCGLTPGDRAVALLPPHWQTAAVLLGCWTAGVATAHAAPSDKPEPVDVVFASADRTTQAREWPADERYALALAPLAAPLREVPDGFADALVGLPRGPLSHRALVATAADRAAALGLVAGGRLLVVDSPQTPARPLDWLLAPLAAGASVVLCRNTDFDRLVARIAQERVTTTLGAP
jgi:uncharacterized protein (TIGR03089 family)